jgi:hypothetical protein
MPAQQSANPWLSIWTQPRQTIRQIVNTNPSFQFVPLCMVYGFPILMHLARYFALGTAMPVWSILLLSIILSPIAGFIGLSFWSVLLKWTGRWVGGRSNYLNIRASVSWSNVPNIVNGAIWLLLGLIVGSELFLPGVTGGISMNMAKFVLILSIIQLIAMVWGLVILIMTLAEVQKFSIWKAIANIVIPCVILLVLGYILNGIFT